MVLSRAGGRRLRQPWVLTRGVRPRRNRIHRESWRQCPNSHRRRWRRRCRRRCWWQWGRPGGAGGTQLSPNGQSGGTGTSLGGGGGGGGWNGNGSGAATLTNTTTLTGGNGGNGGNGEIGGGGVGGGGAGGYGAIVTGTGASSNRGTITGGNGGNGGTGNLTGCGGDGGIGVKFTASGATFTSSGVITGGNGGSFPGGGGVGIEGSGLTITNNGTIAGGLSGNGVTRANAITFTGGTNVLELQAGSNIIGNVVAFSTVDTLRLGGTTNASFDVSQIGSGAQYRGFGTFVKTGASIWTLTGRNAAALSWTINAGTLAVNGKMPSSTMTVNNGGTLAGVGTVGDVTVTNGGTFAPGSGAPGSTMNVVGNLAFQSGALYVVQLNPTSASRANVSGTATLTGGSVQAVLAPGSYASRSNTPSCTLTAASAARRSAASVSPIRISCDNVNYTATDVLLNLRRRRWARAPRSTRTSRTSPERSTISSTAVARCRPTLQVCSA